MTTVDYHHDLKEVQADPGLAALLGVDAQSAPFDRLAWWQGLEAECGLKPVLAVARDGDAIAVLALMAGQGGWSALANYYSFWIKPIISPGADGLTVLTALTRDIATRTHAITFAPLPDEHGEAQQLAAALRQAGWWVAIEPCDKNHILVLNSRDYASYLASRPGPLRTTLKRKAGKVATQIYTQFDAEAWDAYAAIYGESWKPEEGSPAFLRRFAIEEAAGGRLRLGIARADGVALAAQMWTVEHGTAFIHKLAHTEASKSLSPGTTLSAALFRHVIDQDKVQMIDFGTGNDPYKRDWMELVRPRYRIEAFRPFHPANWPKMAKITLRRLARRPQAH